MSGHPGELARDLRGAGLHRATTLSIEAVERRRAQLMTVLLVSMAGLAFAVALLTIGSEDLARRASYVSLPAFRAAPPALVGVLALYVLEKDRHLRRLAMRVAQNSVQIATLAHRAEHDELTGLPNRSVVTERAEGALHRSKSTGELVALLFVDLDRFKDVNDTFGHDQGDAVLVEVAHRLLSAVRRTDVLARWGGDEFAILLEHIESSRQAFDVAERINEVLGPPVSLGIQDARVTASVGVALSSDGHDSAADMVRGADLAMYLAKDAGRACWRGSDAVQLSAAPPLA